MKERNKLEVYMNGAFVGTLAETKERLVAFEYSDEWLTNGFSISPLSLPLERRVFVPKKFDPFDGLFGVFNDSLPDGWGRLLVDRFLQKNGINPASVSPLTRLSIVGESGMGALQYIPSNEMKSSVANHTLDDLARECAKMFEVEKSACLDDLFRMGGSSGGARPKINYEIDGEEWIVKFPSAIDRDRAAHLRESSSTGTRLRESSSAGTRLRESSYFHGIGREEYDYSLCAKACQITMSDTQLLPSAFCDGYFATKRFDRTGHYFDPTNPNNPLKSRNTNGLTNLGKSRIHMVSVSGLLETSHRIPNLDYNVLMQLTLKLTRSYEELEKLFRQMCFNVYAHNRDDHSKNFSFLYIDGVWKLSPAYDLTYSNSIGGEHATTINGNGINPALSDILEVARKANIDEKNAKHIAMEIKEIVETRLVGYL